MVAAAPGGWLVGWLADDGVARVTRRTTAACVIKINNNNTLVPVKLFRYMQAKDQKTNDHPPSPPPPIVRPLLLLLVSC